MKLKDIVNELEISLSLQENENLYYDKKNDCMISISNKSYCEYEELDLEDSDTINAFLDNPDLEIIHELGIDDTRFVKFAPFIHESKIIHEFINEYDTTNRLYNAFNGKGKYRQFKNELIRLNLQKRYNIFYNEFLTNKVIEWCINNDISYEVE